MPQIPFAFEFECKWSNDLCTAKLSFGCSEMFMPFLLKMSEWQFGQTFQNEKYIYIFECEWLNGNSNDLCTAELPFSSSHSNSNANGKWGIQNAPNRKWTYRWTCNTGLLEPIRNCWSQRTGHQREHYIAAGRRSLVRTVPLWQTIQSNNILFFFN